MNENKKRVLNAIDLLKDTAFGLGSSYVDYCFSFNKKQTLDMEKLNSFIDELVTNATRCPEYQPEFEPLMRDGLYMVIVLLSREFAVREYNFLNLMKFVRAWEPNKNTAVSPFDIIIGDRKEQLEPAYMERYTRFSTNIAQITKQFDSFYESVHYAMQSFVDSHDLNPLCNEDECSYIMGAIRRATNSVLIRNTQR